MADWGGWSLPLLLPRAVVRHGRDAGRGGASGSTTIVTTDAPLGTPAITTAAATATASTPANSASFQGYRGTATATPGTHVQLQMMRATAHHRAAALAQCHLLTSDVELTVHLIPISPLPREARAHGRMVQRLAHGRRQ